MYSARRASLRVLGLAMVGCLLLPLVLFVSGAVTIRRAAQRDADDRLGRTADILHEQALKVFQGTEVLLQNLLTLSEGESDDAIRRDFPRWHARLKAISARLGYLQSIWIIGADGRICATDYTESLPDVNASHRDYFKAQLARDDGLYVGAVLHPLLDQGETFFSFSRRRDGPDGRFGGVVTASLMPRDFEQFYHEIGAAPGTFLVMFRTDGALLARFPSLPPGKPPAAQPAVLTFAAGGGERGTVTHVSGTDGRERRLVWRRVDPYPVIVMAGLETSAIHDEWVGTLLTHLLFGVPATALMTAALWIAIIRTRALFDEADRRAAAEEALQRSQRLEALGELTGGVAHDFNNLLMIVLGSVDRMRRRPREASDIRSLDMIVTAVRRGEALTRQLLTFARRRALYPEPVDLAGALEDMRGLITHSLRGDIAVSIEAEAPAGKCVVKVDPAELELAVLNITVNARDAMPAGGHLTLRVWRTVLGAGNEVEDLAGDFVVLSITDTGTGIAPDLLTRVFDPFFTTKDVGKGTGLGLSQVYGFARQSGGTATIRSRPGAGAAVTLYLPASNEVPAQRAAQAQPAIAPGAGLQALLVEDNADVAAVTRMRLEVLGFEVTVAASAATALSLLEAARYALVVSDILMPDGMSGLDLAHEMRTRDVAAPIILASGYSAATEQARREGFTVLQKPYDELLLRSAVAAALSGQRADAADQDPVAPR